MRRLARLLILSVLVSLAAPAARSLAQTSAPSASAPAPSAPTASDPDRLAKLEQQVAEAKSSGDNAWMLMSAALVLMMTGPGLALFYGGLVRRKNVLATMMQSFALMALVTVLWAAFGYSLCFHSGTRFIGNFHYLFLRGVGAQPDPDYAATIPQQTYMIYQLMFAIITPALITGAVAERMKFSAMVLFMALWTVIVYDPMAHMVWGKGGLLNATLGGIVPTLDFAGGTVVHITSGVSALVAAIYLGRRVGYPHEPMPPHSVVLSFIGACLLWVGWFGFNAGSALSAGSPRHQRFRRHPFRRGGRGGGVVRGGMDSKREAQRPGRDFGRGGGTGGDYARLRVCRTHVGSGDWPDSRSSLLSDGEQGESEICLRRFARRLRRARCRRNRGGRADRRVRHPCR